MPMGSTVTPYQLSPNLVAALNMMRTEQDDMSESTQDKQQGGVTEKGVTATASMKAEQNARVILGVLGVMVANLVKQIGELTIDCIIQHTTVGEIDATIPESLRMKFKTITTRTKEGGQDLTHKIEFDSNMVGQDLSKEKASDLEWDMFNKAGGINSKQRHWKINPYKFARTQFSINVDPDQIISRSMGTDQLRKDRAFNLLADPRVSPYVNMPAVIDEFILKEFTTDPDKFKKTPEEIQQEQQNQQGVQTKPQGNEMLNSVMGQGR
jgi:hypothetical protein